MRKRCISSFKDDLWCRLTRNSIVQFVLNSRIEFFSSITILVIVETAFLEDISDLLIYPPLTCTDIANPNK